MFDAESRYAGLTTYVVTDRRGRDVVVVVAVRRRRGQPLLGIHVLRQGERLDHLAARYLDDPTALAHRRAQRRDAAGGARRGARDRDPARGEADGARRGR